MTIDDSGPIVGVVLAGGAGRRIGGAKAARRLAGLPLLDHVVARISPQVALLILNGLTDRDGVGHGMANIDDAVTGGHGPLAGLLAAMDWVAETHPVCQRLLSVPVDTPFLPADLVIRLRDHWNAAGSSPVMAASAGNRHPVVGLWPVTLRHDLRHAMTVEDQRGIGAWAARHDPITVPWPTEPVDPFFNVNSPSDLVAAERMMAALQSTQTCRHPYELG